MDALDRIRRKVGEEAWSRNYMQQPSSSAAATFSDESLQKCLNPLRSVNHEPPKNCSVYIGVDPALGSNNCVIAATPHEGKLKILFIREDLGLTRNEQILGIVEDAILRCMKNGSTVSDVVIEAMVFQKGLSRDERLIEMTERYGFRVREHLTGINKYDENIGVPSMALSFMREEIEIPYAGDSVTRHQADQLVCLVACRRIIRIRNVHFTAHKRQRHRWDTNRFIILVHPSEMFPDPETVPLRHLNEALIAG